ncbi:hypothetical protein ZHAS_00021313 [Anopheles sinensis]|uniref:Uncharacterized protein n=1 Tax=Anopheles sinensis TaxID=74873 RepID=A0A084WS24_ANOSI|nr:hypothetical protein ZHAS_00021313 [Anopheles sinensis]
MVKLAQIETKSRAGGDFTVKMLPLSYQTEHGYEEEGTTNGGRLARVGRGDFANSTIPQLLPSAGPEWNGSNFTTGEACMPPYVECVRTYSRTWWCVTNAPMLEGGLVGFFVMVAGWSGVFKALLAPSVCLLAVEKDVHLFCTPPEARRNGIR